MTNALFLKKDYTEKVIYYLIVLLPITLVSGPFLSDLSVTIITLLFLYISYKKKLFFYYQNKYSKIFGLFFIILIIKIHTKENINALFSNRWSRPNRLTYS